MNRTEKSQFVETLKQDFGKATLAVFADYKGLSAVQADDLRKEMRKTEVRVQVLKNNLARQAVKGQDFSDEVKGLLDGLVGPTLVAFAYGDMAAAAKAVNKFAKDNEAFDLKDSLMGQKKITVAELEALASLPSREVLLGQLLGVMNGPARGFVSVLAAVPRGLVNVLSRIEEQKQGTEQQA